MVNSAFMKGFIDSSRTRLKDASCWSRQIPFHQKQSTTAPCERKSLLDSSENINKNSSGSSAAQTADESSHRQPDLADFSKAVVVVQIIEVESKQSPEPSQVENCTRSKTAILKISCVTYLHCSGDFANAAKVCNLWELVIDDSRIESHKLELGIPTTTTGETFSNLFWKAICSASIEQTFADDKRGIDHTDATKKTSCDLVLDYEILRSITLTGRLKMRHVCQVHPDMFQLMNVMQGSRAKLVGTHQYPLISKQGDPNVSPGDQIVISDRESKESLSQTSQQSSPGVPAKRKANFTGHSNEVGSQLATKRANTSSNADGNINYSSSEHDNRNIATTANSDGQTSQATNSQASSTSNQSANSHSRPTTQSWAARNRRRRRRRLKKEGAKFE